MTQQQLLQIHRATTEACLKLCKEKNNDYSEGGDALRNFKLVDEGMHLTSMKIGIAVRLCDKFARISNLLRKPANVTDESVEDTINDAINYLIILKAAISDEKTKSLDKKRMK